ncbi:MAG TPA: GIY-YIG nuclease family protein [Pelomicrobium sp.]|nr:GIY-YIG nuclease family protein [Pelomicrobium sp.]
MGRDRGLGKAAAPRGTYVLLLESAAAGRCRVGALGALPLVPGVYAYVGSALGPGGLPARLGHHARRAARPHWHIEYLRRQLPLAGVWLDAGGGRLEHAWAETLGQARGVAAVPGFGCSDCGCASHLLHFADPPTAARLRRLLTAAGGAPRHLGGERLALWLDAGASPR